MTESRAPAQGHAVGGSGTDPTRHGVLPWLHEDLCRSVSQSSKVIINSLVTLKLPTELTIAIRTISRVSSSRKIAIRMSKESNNNDISLASGGKWLVTRRVPDTKKQVSCWSGGNAMASVNNRPAALLSNQHDRLSRSSAIFRAGERFLLCPVSSLSMHSVVSEEVVACPKIYVASLEFAGRSMSSQPVNVSHVPVRNV